MTATRSFARRALRWGCVALMLSMAWFSAAPRAGAIDPIQGVGFIPEEGEYLSDQMWSNDDWINVGVELVTSGGTMTIGLLFYAEQYAVSSFFQAYVKPIEFWLNMVQEWRYETGLRAPEDFRMIGGMMMDRRVDITWLQVACADLSRREGWNYVFPIPWATQDDGAALREVDSWFDLGDRGLPDENEPVPPAGTGSNPDAPPITPQLQNAITSQGPSDPDIPTIPIPVRNGRTGIERIQASTNSSKLFQRYLNQLGKAGYLEKSLGIPKGSTFIDLTYDGGVHGADGFFVEPNGKCYLLETKWFDRGGGKLGEITVDLAKKEKIYQASPQWLCKVLYRIKAQDEQRFARIMEQVAGSSFHDVMTMVKLVAENRNALTAEGLTLKEIENFTDLEKVMSFIKSPSGLGEQAGKELLGNVGKWVESEIQVSIVTKKGHYVEHMAEAGTGWTKWARSLGARSFELAKSIIKAKVE